MESTRSASQSPREPPSRAARADRGPPETRDWVLAARDALRRGDLADALSAVRRELPRLREAPPVGGLAGALSLAAHVFGEAGYLEKALDSGAESLSVAQAEGDGWAVARAFRAIGVSHLHLRHEAEASRMLREALKVSMLVDDGALQAHVMADLAANMARLGQSAAGRGETAAARERYEDAVDYAERGLSVARRVRDAHAQARTGAAVALARLAIADVCAATQGLGEARAHVSAGGFGLLGYRLGILEGCADLAQGDAAAGAARLEVVASACRQRGLAMIELDASRELHRAARAAGDFALALDAHERLHELESRVTTEAAQARARALMNEVETRNARLETEKARLEAELLRMKSRRLESEKRALQAQTRELDRHANQDPLTGLWNRRYVDDELPRLHAACLAKGRPLTVAVGDIDFFKHINDRYGHPKGDEVLCAVADILRDGCRPTDVVARVGGEEFLLILEDTTPEGAWHVCERMRQAVEACAWEAIAPGLAVNISIGVSTVREAPEASVLIASADRNLYAAKQGGRNRVDLGLAARAVAS